jgi:hypothetical protein
MNHDTEVLTEPLYIELLPSVFAVGATLPFQQWKDILLYARTRNQHVRGEWKPEGTWRLQPTSSVDYPYTYDADQDQPDKDFPHCYCRVPSEITSTDAHELARFLPAGVHPFVRTCLRSDYPVWILATTEMKVPPSTRKGRGCFDELMRVQKGTNTRYDIS